MFLLICLGLFVLWRTALWIEVRNQFAALRRTGLPTSGQELNAWLPSVPGSANGALVLTQAFALLREPPRGFNESTQTKLLSRTSQWSASDRDLIADYVRTNAPALRKATEARHFNQFQFPVDYSYGPATDQPQLRDLRKLVRILSLATALQIEEGRTNEWPENIALQLQLAATLDGEPTVMSHLVRNSLVRMAATATERSLNRAGCNDEAAGRLGLAFAQAIRTNSLPLALIGERALTIPVFRLSWREIQSSSRDGNEDPTPGKPQQYTGKPNPVLWFSGFFERDLSFFLKTMETSLGPATLSPPESLRLTNVLDNAESVAGRRGFLFSGMLLPSLGRAAVRDASTQARLRAAVASLAIERFRLSQGRLPAGLSELTPRFLDAIPADPFDSAPLRYKLLPKGYLIYSVDADGREIGRASCRERV